MMSRQTIVARSLGESSTSSERSGSLPNSARWWDQAKKAWNNMRPKTRNSKAGERPTRLNGALGDAITIPHELRLLKPKLMRMTAMADNITPIVSILIPLCRGTGFNRKLSRKTMIETKVSKPKE